NSSLDPCLKPYFCRIFAGMVIMLLLVTVATWPKKSADHVNGGSTMQLSVSHCSMRFGPSWAALVSYLGTRLLLCTGGPGFLSSGSPYPCRRRHSSHSPCRAP